MIFLRVQIKLSVGLMHFYTKKKKYTTQEIEKRSVYAQLRHTRQKTLVIQLQTWLDP